MSTRRIRLAAAVLIAVVCAAVDAGADERVRTGDPSLAATIRDARAWSPTFARLVDAIAATDGVVFVERGRCGHGMRGCLLMWIAVAGPRRVLQVIVDDRLTPKDAMGTIAHELRHALEIFAEPRVTTREAMYFFYQREGTTQGRAFETRAAIKAGDAVRRELRKR